VFTRVPAAQKLKSGATPQQSGQIFVVHWPDSVVRSWQTEVKIFVEPRIAVIKGAIVSNCLFSVFSVNRKDLFIMMYS
jgi:hypothetical protein